MLSERTRVHIGLAAAVFVLVACMALIIGGAIRKGDLHAALPGSVAPDFYLLDADNKPVALSELRGDVVIVYFQGQPGDFVAAPTSEPSDSPSAVAAAEVKLPVLNQIDAANASSGTALDADKSVAAAPAANIAELSAMCRDLHNPRVKLLNLESVPAASPVDSMASAPSGDTSVQTLFDPSGDVAREYKIDKGDAKPTFFVIDPSGVIRYRGSSVSDSAASAADQLLSPATQPTSAQQITQTLFSSEALSLPPAAGHF